MTREFVDARTFIGKTVRVSVDRPLGSRHPDAGFVYPVNYGFLPGVPAPDGEESGRLYSGCLQVRSETFTGTCIAVIRRSDDDDDKLVIAPSGKDFSDETDPGVDRISGAVFQVIHNS